MRKILIDYKNKRKHLSLVKRYNLYKKMDVLVVGEQGSVIVYFKGTSDIFGIDSNEQGTPLLLMGTFPKKVRN